MLARISAFLVWALVAATAVFWGLRLFAKPAATPPHVVAVAPSAGGADLTRLFGAPPPAPLPQVASVPASSRFRLLGVMAPRGAKTTTDSRYGLALISIDGKPARAYRVGARVENDLVLQSVGWRSAAIGGAGQPPAVLELPLPTPPNTATSLPPVGSSVAAPIAVHGSPVVPGTPPPQPYMAPPPQPYVPPAQPYVPPAPAVVAPPPVVTPQSMPQEPQDSMNENGNSNGN
ncbi:type II secretion system protein N [Piscinibacter koreensis]|uniref:Type II secretion system protein GspC N-terminal domain-containing protein n=1 Tax=Piscinibacter koreensis TaxID=2742824 RepID=A0A7Y6NLX0_9BURK|nr:type II secretion system protein N [Schlegelella koreensis]NUZ05623.1 hypothetical protein [Schlegelella koreensis]